MSSSARAWPDVLAHHPNSVALFLELAALVIVLALLTWVAWRGHRRGRTLAQGSSAPMRDETNADQ
jgi:ABC-type transport system involved in cytochrome bd biosynthesis fused ATPase/permease subunit